MGNRIVVAEFIQDGNDVDQIARVGRLMHTVDARSAGIAHDASNRFVRRDHRLFHKRGRVVSPSKIDRKGTSLIVETHLRLFAVEIDASHTRTTRPKRPRDPMKGFETCCDGAYAVHIVVCNG